MTEHLYRPLHVPAPRQRCFLCGQEDLMGARSELGLCRACIYQIVLDCYGEPRPVGPKFPLVVHSPTGTREITLMDASEAMWARARAKRYS